MGLLGKQEMREVLQSPPGPIALKAVVWQSWMDSPAACEICAAPQAALALSPLRVTARLTAVALPLCISNSVPQPQLPICYMACGLVLRVLYPFCTA